MRKVASAVVILAIFLMSAISTPEIAGVYDPLTGTRNREDMLSPADWITCTPGRVPPRPVELEGLQVSSGTSVIDSTRSGYIGISTPLGWSSEQLEGQLDHLSMWVDDVLVNPKLDAYHEELWFPIDGYPEYNNDPFFVPDGWTFVKNDAPPSGTQHPQHGYFELNGRSGEGYDGTIGWRFDANYGSGAMFDPSKGIYMTQQVAAPWREVYSAEITFLYYVSSVSDMNDEVFIFTRLEDYISKHHVFVVDTPTDTWLQASATVPSSFFESLEVADSLLLDIGLGTDIDGLTGASSDHEVYIDEIELKLLARPLPEQIDLRANGAKVTGSTTGSVSPYVPDGGNRDCYSAPNSNGGAGGVDLDGYGNDGVLEVGADAPSHPDWSDAYSYQVGLQFPLNVPRGAKITSAHLQVEAGADSVGLPGMRIFVADEDDISAFSSGMMGNALLPDIFDWVNTSIYWRPTTWTINGRYDTPDLSALIQEVVSRPGWQSGDYICIMIDYAYSSQQYAYNGVKGSTGYSQADLARLFVDFLAPQSEDTIPSFKYNKDIVIDHTKVASNLVDFPVLVDIWDEDLHFNVQPDGDDIAFLYNGQFLSHEIESFDKKGNGTHAHLVCWVKVPQLSSVVDTTITMVYGDDDLGSQEDPEGVWENGFATVWHLNNNPSQPQWDSTHADYLPHQPQILDSIPPIASGTTYGTMTSTDSVSGIIGNAIDLEGANDYVDFGNPTELQMAGAFTVEAWFKADFVDNDYLVVKSGESGYRGWDISFDDDPTISPAGWVMFRFSPDGTNTDIVGYERVDRGQWYHVVGVFCPSVFARFYLNGDLVEELTTGIPVSVNDPNYPVRIGRRSDNPGGTSYLDALVDEVRISNVARSDSWIKTQYNNQRNPGRFLTVEEEGVNFLYMKDIIIDHNKVAADLTGFPVLIDIYDSDLRTKVQSDGDDIMFTLNGKSLPHEIELFDQQFNATHAHLIAWVKADLSSTFDTMLTMYYSNPSIGAQENPSEVWRADYAGVWHLGELSGNAIDSTSFGLAGSVSAGVTRNQLGVVGSCYEFNGANGNVNFGNPSDSHLDFGGNTFTYSLWVRVDQSTGNYQLPLFKGGTTTSDPGYECETNVGGLDLKAEVSDGTTQVISDSTTVTFGQWMYIVAVVDVSAGLLRFYRNGAQVGTSKSISSLGDVSSSESFQISPLSYPINGAIDEVRLISEARSTGWILTEFNNQEDPSSFYSVGAEESFGETVQFDYKKDITIDHNQVFEDLVDFPVLIEIYDTDLRTDVQPDGDDIIFKSGEIQLPHEIETFEQSYNDSHAHLVAWVKADLLSSTDTVITMYYGNPTIEKQEDSAGVWNSNYAGVWHLSEDPTGTLYDSTTNLNHGTGYNLQSEDQVDGQIDGSIDFDNNQDHIHCGNDTSLNVGSNDFSLSLWFKYDGVDMGVLAGKGAVLMAKRYRISIESGPGLLMAEIDDNTVAKTVFSTSTYGDNLWHHVSMVRDGNNLRLYIDGVEDPNSPNDITGYGSLDESESFYIGAFRSEVGGTIGYWSTANTDEVRVAKLAHSPEWIATEYNNQDDPAGFYSVGTETALAPSGYKYKKVITIDHTKVPSNLAQFPVLIDLYDSDLRTDVQPDGDDIVFKIGDTILPHEIELFQQSYNTSHAHLVAWVGLPTLSSSLDTEITMFYGDNNAESSENPQGVWSAGYAGIWHLSEDPSSSPPQVKDSTSPSSNGTTYGSMSSAELVADGALAFDGLNDYVDFGNPAELQITGELTIEAWVRTGAIDQDDIVISKSGSIGQYSWTLDCYYLIGNPFIRFRYSTDGTIFSATQIAPFEEDSLYHVCVVFNPSNYVRLYLNGTQSATNSTATPASLFNAAAPIQLSSSTKVFNGIVDEVRISNTVRSADWILTEYRNQQDPTSFYTVGPEENAAGQEFEFSYKKDIVVDHNKVDADLTEFPLLIDIFDTDLRTDVQPDGDDIIFKSGTVLLPHEIELFDQNHNSTHAHLVAWVKTDLSSTVDTILAMYYSNPQAPSQENPNNVWNQDYMGVWHLGETSGGSGAIKDSTSNINHGTDAGNPTFGIGGPIGNAMLFDGTDDTINCGNGPSLTIAGNTMTIEAWAYLNEDTAPQWGSGIAHKAMSYQLFQDWDASRRFSFEMNADSRTWVSDTNKDMYRWYHVVGVYDGVSTYIYVDGIQRGFFPNTGPIDATVAPFYIGRGDQYFDGRIDEVRVLNVSKSAEWILAEFRNQNDPSGFYSMGAEVPAQTGSIDTTGFQFTTNSTSAITIGTKISQSVTKSAWSFADDYSLGTSFSVSNGSIATWTANVMVSPPPEIDSLTVKISYAEGEWIPTQVVSPLGVEKTLHSDWNCFDGEVSISNTAVDEYGMWKVKFQDNNHILDTLVGPSGGPFSSTGVFSVGQDISFRFWSSGVPGSTMSLRLIDPTGSTWYSGTGSFQGERFAIPYSYRKDLTIEHTLVTSNLVDFPVLIDTYDADLRTKTRLDGKDIAFACGDTALSHEIELFDQSFNSTHAHLIAWVKVPLLSASVDTIVTMYYGNPTAPIVEDPAGVWDPGYLGVWHLSESGDGSPDEYSRRGRRLSHCVHSPYRFGMG